MKEKYKYLSKNIILFTISNFIPRIISFFLVPIYTGCLTTSEYGIAELINTTVQLLIPILTIGIKDAVMRFSLDNKYDKKDVFSTGVQLILGGTGFLIVASYIIYLIPFIKIKGMHLIFTVLIFFFTSSVNTIYLFFRGIDKVKVMVHSSIINSFTTLLANVIFLVYFDWGLFGYLLANIIGYMFAFIYCFIVARLSKYVKFKVDKRTRKDMCIYGFPLIFNIIGWWVNNASDRYIVSWLEGVAVSGIYALAYKIPSLITLFQNIIYQAWAISAIKEFDKDDKDGFMGNMYTLFNMIMLGVCSLIMILNIPFASILYSNEFFAAWKYVPPLLIAMVFNAMSLFIGGIFTAVKDTKALSQSTVIGAVINTVLNFILIFYWGAYGAAIATLIGYFVVYIIRYFKLRKYIHMKINILRDMLGYTILIVQMLLALKGNDFIVLQGISLLVLVVCYYKEINKIIKMVKSLVRKYVNK